MSKYGPLHDGAFEHLEELYEAAQKERYAHFLDPKAPMPRIISLSFAGGETEARMLMTAAPIIGDMIYAVRYLSAENEHLRRVLSGEMTALESFRHREETALRRRKREGEE